MGPGRPRSTVLSEAEEAIVVEFRRRTLLPLDDVLGCLRDETCARVRETTTTWGHGPRLHTCCCARSDPRTGLVIRNPGDCLADLDSGSGWAGVA
jgi:hypothetical protein